MTSSKARLGACLRRGFFSGARVALWLVSLVVPVSFLVAALRYTGALQVMARWIAPGFDLLGLPGESAVAFLTGGLVNCYSGIAAMGAIPLTHREITILALMILFFHNIVVEAPVQQKTGSKAWILVLLRLFAALLSAIALHHLLPPEVPSSPRPLPGPATFAVTSHLGPYFLSWVNATARLVLKMGSLVIALTILQRLLDEFRITRWLESLAAPLLRLMGLPRSVAFLWIVANTLGLAFGSAILISEYESGKLSPRDCQLLNLSVALCHSLLEDTLLFVAMGASALWITLPRILLASGVVWAYRGFSRSESL